MCKKIKKENKDFFKKTEKQIQKKLKVNYKMHDTSYCFVKLIPIPGTSQRFIAAFVANVALDEPLKHEDSTLTCRL